jgi:hypothetical protein
MHPFEEAAQCFGRCLRGGIFSHVREQLVDSGGGRIEYVSETVARNEEGMESPYKSLDICVREPVKKGLHKTALY